MTINQNIPVLEIIEWNRAAGKQIVVIQGLGYVGSSVAAVVANAIDANDQPRYLVIGIDLPNEDGLSKIEAINRGEAPIQSPDPEFTRLVQTAVLERNSLVATSDEAVYSLADVIVITIPLGVKEYEIEGADQIELDAADYIEAIHKLGRMIQPGTLIIVESTVPVGTCRQMILPIIQDEFANRQISGPFYLAHAYERVMPGPNYINSIRRFWRTYSGIDKPSAEKARAFLSSFIDTENFPLCELENTESSEMAKLMENSYRALNIAFMEEWTKFAEQIGIDLYQVVNSIRVRKGTHDNMRYPGFGVGGYCLPKDGMLAQWSIGNFYQSDLVLDMTLSALRTNHYMPLHTLDLINELADGSIDGKSILICGISYLPEMADTRNSPTSLLVDALCRGGAQVAVHDPFVASWGERPDVQVIRDLNAWRQPVDGVVLAVAHKVYLKTIPQWLSAWTNPLPFIVDANNVLPDDIAEQLHSYGARLLGVGKGHWRRRGYSCN